MRIIAWVLLSPFCLLYGIFVVLGCSFPLIVSSINSLYIYASEGKWKNPITPVKEFWNAED